jgi:hypothetical protein
LSNQTPGQPVAEAWRRFDDSRRKYGAATKHAEVLTAVRGIYQAVADACAAYGAPGNNAGGKGPVEPFPAEMALILADLIGNQLAGRRTYSFEDICSDRNRSLMPAEQRDVNAARLYLMACKSGIIADPTHTKSVMEWFGVARSTAMSWARIQNPSLSLDNFYPDADTESRAALITSQTKKAGRRYAANGRGQKAIAQRGKGRSG